MFRDRWVCFVELEKGAKPVRIERGEIVGCLNQGHRLWIDVLNPTAEDTGWLEDVFDFHALALSDVLNNEVRPKQEPYEDFLFTVFGGINHDPAEFLFDTINLNLFLTSQCLVTAHLKPLSIVDSVIRRIEKGEEILVHGPDHLYYVLLDELVDRYVTTIDGMEEEVDALEDAVFDGMEPDFQEKLFELKRKVTYGLRALRPKREALKILVYREPPNITPAVQTHLRDVLDHVQSSIDHLESFRELLNNLMDSYMIRISNRSNQVMVLLSVIATIMLPLTFITGIFGMNFQHIPGLDSRFGFWAVSGFMAMMSGGMVWAFRKRGIL